MTDHMDYIENIARNDVAVLRHKERTYGGSWKKRGGVGAFMMLARKMDRIENIATSAGYDIFEVIRREGLGGADGELLAEIRDLRAYLLLVEAEMACQLTRATHLADASSTQQRRGTEHPAPFGYSAKDEI